MHVCLCVCANINVVCLIIKHLQCVRVCVCGGILLILWGHKSLKSYQDTSNHNIDQWFRLFVSLQSILLFLIEDKKKCIF